MIQIQLSSKDAKEIIDLLKKEIDMNPSGFIDLKLTSYDKKKDKDLIVPTPNWSDDRNF